MAHDTPHLLDRLVLVGPPVGAASAGRDALMAVIEDAWRIRDFLQSGASRPLSLERVASAARDMARTTGAAGRAQLSTMMDADWEGLMASVSCPVQVGAGELDWWGGGQKLRDRIGRVPTMWREVGRHPIWEDLLTVVNFITDPVAEALEDPTADGAAATESGAGADDAADRAARDFPNW
jgi:hypothetical protein